jgi:hypothetical protein
LREGSSLPEPASLKNPWTRQGQTLLLIIAAGSRRNRRETDDAQKSMVWVWHEYGVSGYASSVIALRTLRITAGDVVAEVEACRMVSEKIATGWLYRLALTAGLALRLQASQLKC